MSAVVVVVVVFGHILITASTEAELTSHKTIGVLSLIGLFNDNPFQLGFEIKEVVDGRGPTNSWIHARLFAGCACG